MTRIFLTALAALALAVPAATAAPTRGQASPSIAAIAAQTPQFSTLLSLANAAFVGAKTVYAPGFESVSARPAFFTSESRVENCGV